MAIFFALSLPGFVIIVMILGVVQLIRAKKSGKRRPGAATAGLDLLDLVLKPGSEFRIVEVEEQKRRVVDAENSGDPLKDK